MTDLAYRFQIGENVLVYRRGEWHGGHIVTAARVGRFWPVDRYQVVMADGERIWRDDWAVTKIRHPIAFCENGVPLRLVVDNGDLLPSEVEP